MDQFNNNLFYGFLVIFVLFFIFWVYKYLTYWNKLKEAYQQLGMRWPFPGQKEMPEELKNDFIKRAFLVYTSPIRALRVLFMRTNNPVLLRPLRAIRRCFFVFILFPVVVAFIMIVIAAITMR